MEKHESKIVDIELLEQVALDVLEVFKKYRLTPADIDAVLGFLRFYNTAAVLGFLRFYNTAGV